MPVKKVKVKSITSIKSTTGTTGIKKARDTRGTRATRDTLSIDVYDLKGKVVEKLALPKEIFGAKVNSALVAQAVRVYLANQRSGTASTKTRGEVQGSTRKIWRQKGTGRARHGGIRAPIFVKGGIAFGPKPRDFSLDLPKKMRRLALFSVLSQKYKDGHIRVVKGLEKIEPKTKEMVSVMSSLEVNSKNKKVLLVIPQTENHIQVVKAARNITGVEFIQASQLNTYQTLENKIVLFMRDALPVVEKTFLAGGKQ